MMLMIRDISMHVSMVYDGVDGLLMISAVCVKLGLEKGNKANRLDLHLKTQADAAQPTVTLNNCRSIKASTPVIYKDSNSATASGVCILLNGKWRIKKRYNTQGGFIFPYNQMVEQNQQQQQVPRTIAPTNAEGKSKLYCKDFVRNAKIRHLLTQTRSFLLCSRGQAD